MISTLTHATSEIGFELFLDNEAIKTSQYFKTISTSQDGSFNNKSYRPFILEIDINAIDIFKGKPCFYLPGYSEVYLEKYGLFNPRFLWEWEIFFTNEIPMHYITAIYVVSIDGTYPTGVEKLLDRYEREYGNVEVITYDYEERHDFWGEALGYEYSEHITRLLNFYGITYEDLLKPEYKDILEDVMEYLDTANRITAENTNTMDIYDKIYNEFINKHLK